MKQIVCEMCGSTKLQKQDGFYVCQECGAQYSTEEARKLLQEVEGERVVEAVAPATGPSGKSEELENLYTVARRAKSDNNSETAQKYYDMILVKDPMSWEASFFATYYSAMQTNIANIESAAHKVSNCIDTVMGLISEHTEKDAQPAAVTEVTTYVCTIATMLASSAKNHYNGISSDIKSNYTQEMLDRVCAARDLEYNLGNQIENFFGDDERMYPCIATAWKSGISTHESVMIHFANRDLNRSTINGYKERICKYEPSYRKPMLQDRVKEINSTIACTDVEGKRQRGCGGPLVLGLAIGSLIGAVAALLMDVAEVATPFLIAAAVLGVIAIPLMMGKKPKPEVIEANIAKVNKLKEEKAELEKEIESME